MSVRWLAAILAAALLLACQRSADESVEVSVDGTPVPTPTATGTASTATASPAPTTAPPPTPTPLPWPDLDPDDLYGFTQPVENACLPFAGAHMPNAPRRYRHGVHEGVDIYPGFACAAVERGTPILAVHHGEVVRADLDYVDITAEQIETLAARTAEQGHSDPETLDIYRGRQVWIDHGSGIVTRYAHLDSIAAGIEIGTWVRQGQVIGGMGESGTPESLLAPGTDIHLHYEVRVGDSFLGDGLEPDIVRGLYERLFSDPSAPGASDGPPPVLYVHTAREADTARSVAEEYGIGPEFVAWNNDGVDGPDDPIEAGTRLRIPGVEGIIHVVAAGETLTTIAQRYGANIGSIVAFRSNGLPDPNLLSVGATILVPGGRILDASEAPALTPEPTLTPEATAEATAEPEATAPADGEEADAE